MSSLRTGAAISRLGFAVLASGLASLVSACGDDDEPHARGAVSTGLPSNARLSELSDAERAQGCRALFGALSEALEGQLTRVQCQLDAVRESVAISFSGQVRFDQAECEQRVDACLASAVDGGADVGASAALAGIDCSSPAATEAQRSCDATVAQYERCYSAVVADFGSVVQVTGCAQALETLNASAAMSGTGTRVPPPDCAELMRRCPQISVPGTRPTPPASRPAE